jgi:hypothetical protein
MAQPQLQIDRRVDRLEQAVQTLAAFMSPELAEEIDKILRGEKPTDKPEEEHASE